MISGTHVAERFYSGKIDSADKHIAIFS
jgi:hypothetical protein